VFKKFVGPVDERFTVALVQKARTIVEPGWLLGCFTTDAGTVILIFQALLATKYHRNIDFSAALNKLLDSGIDVIDEGFLRKAFQGLNKVKVNTEQTITDFAISIFLVLLQAFPSRKGGIFIAAELQSSEGHTKTCLGQHLLVGTAS
jgi:hypothetical protein